MQPETGAPCFVSVTETWNGLWVAVGQTQCLVVYATPAIGPNERFDSIFVTAAQAAGVSRCPLRVSGGDWKAPRPVDALSPVVCPLLRYSSEPADSFDHCPLTDGRNAVVAIRCRRFDALLVQPHWSHEERIPPV